MWHHPGAPQHYRSQLLEAHGDGLDKTGTLSQGKLRVTRIVAAPGLAEAEWLAMAVSLERSSEHPFAAAILAK